MQLNTINENSKFLVYAKYTFLGVFISLAITAGLEWLFDTKLFEVSSFFLFASLFFLSIAGMKDGVIYKPFGQKVIGKGARILGFLYFMVVMIIVVTKGMKYFHIHISQDIKDITNLVPGIIVLALMVALAVIPNKKALEKKSEKVDKRKYDEIKNIHQPRIVKYEDSIDYVKQSEMAKKIYDAIGQKQILYWKNSKFLDRDIGGTMFDICPHCGGKKSFTKGDDDYEDNTEQYVSCNFCGWRGYRRIKYQRYGDASKMFTKSILADFSEENDAIDRTTLQSYFPKDIKEIESFYIDWGNEKVVFIFTTIKNKEDEIVLDLDNAYKVFVALGVYYQENLPPLKELLKM